MIRAIGRTGRVTDAAEILGLTPSALSHRIKEAERRLGVPLFERLHKRLRMTAAAEYLADVSDRLIRELELVEADVRRMNSGLNHVVRVAVEAYSSYHWLPAFLIYLRGKATDIDIQVMAAAGRDPLQALANRQVDVVIASGSLPYRQTRSWPLFEDPLVFITAPDHRLAGKTMITGEDIDGETFVTYTKVPEPDREFAKLFRSEGRYPRWTATVELPEAIVELVAAGQGTSVLASWAMRPHVESGRIVALQVGADGIIIPWRALTRDDEPESGPVSVTAEHLMDWCATPQGGF
jgi:LysR family transcriptional regulator for metE and metH